MDNFTFNLCTVSLVWCKFLHSLSCKCHYKDKIRLMTLLTKVIRGVWGYLTENLPSGQLPPMLWRWLVGLLSPKTKKKKEKKKACHKTRGNMIFCGVYTTKVGTMISKLVFSNTPPPNVCHLKGLLHY